MQAPADAVPVGRIEGAYGVRGALRIEPFNVPHESVLLKVRRWYLKPSPSHRLAANVAHARDAIARKLPASRGSPSLSDPPRPDFALPAMVEVLRCRVHGMNLIANLRGIEIRELAQALRGCEILVSRADFPPAAEGEYYWTDLIGCAVSTIEGVPLGVVTAVDDHGAHPLLRLQADDGRERLIPFVEAHVPEVDVAARRIVVDWDPDF